MTISTTSDQSTPSLKQLAAFLSDYSAWLLGSGATCIRLEKNIGRIAASFGKDVEVAIMPRHVHISVSEADSHEVVTAITPVRHCAISFNINTRLSELSWEIADSKINFSDAVDRFHHIVSSDSQNKWLVLTLVSMANASFCRLFGGDAAAMAIVGFATLAGYYLKIWLLAKGIDNRLMAIICAFVSAVLGATDMIFHVGNTPAVAIGTSVLYLVPGIPFLNSFSDMLYRHYLCAFSRFADAIVMTCCLSIGLCAAMLMMNTGMF